MLDRILPYLGKTRKKPDIRISTSGFIFCYLEKYGLFFDVVNVSPEGFLLKPSKDSDLLNLTAFKKDILENSESDFRFTFYMKNDTLTAEIRASIKAIEDGNLFAFRVKSSDRKKFEQIYKKAYFLYEISALTCTVNAGISSTETQPDTARTSIYDHIGSILLLSGIEEKKISLKEKKLKYGLYVIFFVLFFLLGFFVTLIQNSLKEHQLNTLIEKYEKEHNAKIVYLVHRKRTIGLFGFPVYEYLETYDAHRLLRELSSIPHDKNLVIIIHSPGGELLAAIQIAKALKNWKGKVYAVVPYYAMSAGTLISLASDEIITKETATFGPIDPQIPIPENEKYYVSAITVLESFDHNIDGKNLKNKMLYITSKKVVKEVENFLRNTVLVDKPQEVKDRIIRTLLYTRKTHDFPVFADDLKKLGLNVKCSVPEDLERIVDLLINSHRPGT